METVPFVNTSLLDSAALSHGLTLRHRGVSVGPYDSLNLGLHVGDDPACVRENRRRAAESLGFSLKQMVCAEQVHGNRVAVVTAMDVGRGATELSTAVRGVDALVTDTPGLLLALFYADCLPVMFYDAEHRVVGVAHAGWRGLVNGVIENTIQTMQDQFGVCPERLQAALFPCIGPNYFEVGDEVAAQFPGEVVSRNDETAKAHVDLAKAARLRLEAVSIRSENIASIAECTVTEAERYFSHRRDRGMTGRMGAMIGIRP